MRQLLVPVLLLAAVALSASNVLPITSSDRLDLIATNGQQNDNILSNKYNTRNVLNSIFYTAPVKSTRSSLLLKKISKYLNTINNQAGNFDDIVNEDDNYDGEGFRKEQWHNYPRQLDRLHEYLSNYPTDDIKRSSDSDDPGFELYDSSLSKERVMDDTPTDDYIHDSNKQMNDLYDSILDTNNPLLILKVHLTHLNKRFKNSHKTKINEAIQAEYMNIGNPNLNQEENLYTNEINPAMKVKREGSPQDSQSSGDNLIGEPKTVNKRLFSLWSRLQSLSHKGHELPHRRHLAFYGFPDNESGGGTLTAETRATFMRPPGSPLRWG